MRDAVGLLLAGGAGVRLGGATPKPLALLEGETLLARAMRTLESVCPTCALAAGDRADLPDPGWPRLADAAGARGPLAGVVAGLRFAGDRPLLVLAVDFPLVRSPFLGALLDRLVPPWQAVVPAPGGVLQPVCAVFAPSARPPLEARLAAGERSITAALDDLAVRRLDDAALADLALAPDELLNVNRPADLEEAARRLRAARSA
jgi:molybdopterin-guanine dinucleotide biosynthesis protein A